MEVITTHLNADFDALASMVAAKKLYPDAELVFAGSQEKVLRDFLSQEFRDLYADFAKANTVVVGISRDSIKSHEGFKAAHSFPFELLADTDEQVCELFGVMKLKNMYGKQVRGVERSTFVFDANGKIVKSWRGLKAPGHAAEVLAFVQTL